MKDKGINIKTIHTDKFKTVCIAILIKQPLDKNNVSKNAIFPKLFLMGNKNYKTIRDINIKIESIGAYIYSDILKKGDYQIIEFMIEMPSIENNIEEGFKFLSDIILNPLVEDNAFCKHNVEKSKEVLIESIKSDYNDKKLFAKNRTLELMCEDEPFSIRADGYVEELEKPIDEKELYKHYLEILKTSQIDIMAIGNLKEQELNNLAEKYFVIENRNYIEKNLPFIKKEENKPKFVDENQNITQGKLCMGFRCNIEANTKEFVNLMVANQLFGGFAGSLLFNNIREKESLCYYINSFIFMFKGIVLVQSGVEFDSYENVYKKVLENFEYVKNGQFSDEDMIRAKNSLIKRYLGMLDNNTSCLDYYYTSYLANIDRKIEDMIEQIKKVDKKGIIEAFEKLWFDICYFMKGDKIDR